MTKVDKFKWTAVGSAAAILAATVILAFVAPIYLITLWLGFAAGYISVHSLVLFIKEKEKEESLPVPDQPDLVPDEVEREVDKEAAPMPVSAEPEVDTKVEEEKETKVEKPEKATSRKKSKK